VVWGERAKHPNLPDYAFYFLPGHPDHMVTIQVFPLNRRSEWNRSRAETQRRRGWRKTNRDDGSGDESRYFSMYQPAWRMSFSASRRLCARAPTAGNLLFSVPDLSLWWN